ncbi:MAG: serine protease [Tannerella sp.]|jgi:Flp pilus assembly protein TadD|nr:serine protease [Tannerella sp.]
MGQKKPPKWVDNATKAIFKVEASSKEGLVKTGNGFFVGEDGEGVSAYDLFRGAEKAVVITASGERFNVTQILGADDMYGVARFKVAVPKKTSFLTVAKIAPTVNSIVYLLPSSEEKGLASGTISEISKVKGVDGYYKIDMPLPVSQEAFPLLNEKGEVFALTQADASGKGKTYGISVDYIRSLRVSAMDLLKRTYSEIGIRKAWTSNAEDSRISLLLAASQQDAKTYLETLNDFIATFPDDFEGYISRAEHYAYHRRELAADEASQLAFLDLAMADLDKAETVNKDKSAAHYEKAKLIYGIATSDTTLQYKDWNIATAETELMKALAEKDDPIYHLLEGDIAFYENDFEKAYQAFSIVNKSSAASGASFYLAAKSCRQLPGFNLMEIIALMDSAINRSPADEAASYLLERVELNLQMGLYKDAVRDYDRYYLLVNGNVNDGFYYYREQAKFRAEDFEGALHDINSAIIANDKNAIYYAEKAAVCLRLKDYTQAQASAEDAIKLQSDFASAYRILGISLLRQEKKEACVQFTKAKEFGDTVVDKLINENCK